jgi:hypothetical protein
VVVAATVHNVRRRARKSGAFLLALGIIAMFLSAFAPGAGADSAGGFTTPQGVTVTSGGENCNGIVPTPGSENTNKTLDATSDLRAGGTARYVIAFPSGADNVGDFEIVDCVVYVPQGESVHSYSSVLAEATLSGVNNSEQFSLAFSFSIPANAANGDQICNVAKTTQSPSHAQQSNRKAGPACFIIGGQGRVEKHDAQTGDKLDGATFSIHDCVNPAPKPALQPIIVSLENAAGDPLAGAPVAGSDGLVSGSVSAAAMGFNGPSGASCQVTETAPPPGYLLSDATSVTVTMGVNAQTVRVFDDEPVPTTTTTEAPTTTTTAAPTTTTTEPPTTEAPTPSTAAPTTTVAPVVAGEVIQPGSLPRTGADVRGELLLAGLALVLGGVAVMFGERKRATATT